MAPQIPWSPTAHAFAQHQFSHVTNFWKQCRQASFRLEALSSGKAELNLTFQLPHASEVIPPPSAPSHVFPASAPQRPIHPLFPNGFFPQRSGVTNPASQKKPSSKQRKSYRRSVLYRASLAAPSLSPPKNGSLRQAALASVKHLQAVSASPVDTQSYRKRSYSESDSPSAHSPSRFPPLAQRIRSDLQIGDESPERELLRTQPSHLKSPPPSCPRVKGFPPPAPLAFTPPKIQEGCETPAPLVFPPEKYNCSNCEAEMTPDHQCEAVIAASSLSSTPPGSPNRTIAEQKFSEFRMRWIGRIDKSTDDWALKAKLLETLEDAYLAPVSVLSDGDLNAVKDQFFEGLLSPVKFLEKLQNLLGKNW